MWVGVLYGVCGGGICTVYCQEYRDYSVKTGTLVGRPHSSDFKPFRDSILTRRVLFYEQKFDTKMAIKYI